MSSVLKALKNQSSPLVRSSSEVRLSSATVAKTGVVQFVQWLVLVAVAIAVGWLTVQWFFSATEEEPLTKQMPLSSTQQPSAVELSVNYQLGSVAAIKTPQWPAPVEEQPMPVRTVEQSQESQHGQESPVNENQAIDLSQVSPELLSAFESALADDAQNDGRSNFNNSVVPELAQLNPTFQRTIPSFSYDGHQYSSRPQSRWIQLSGVRLFEGERFQGLTVLTIAPAHVVLTKDNQAFQQPALEDWTNP